MPSHSRRRIHPEPERPRRISSAERPPHARRRTANRSPPDIRLQANSAGSASVDLRQERVLNYVQGGVDSLADADEAAWLPPSVHHDSELERDTAPESDGSLAVQDDEVENASNAINYSFESSSPPASSHVPSRASQVSSPPANSSPPSSEFIPASAPASAPTSTSTHYSPSHQPTEGSESDSQAPSTHPASRPSAVSTNTPADPAIERPPHISISVIQPRSDGSSFRRSGDDNQRSAFIPLPPPDYHSFRRGSPQWLRDNAPAFIPARPGESIVIPGRPGTERTVPDVKADAPIWTTYVQEASEQDKDQIEKWDKNMDVILVFAGLFSAILTAFIIEFYKLLQQDPQDTTNALLQNVTATLQAILQNPDGGGTVPIINDSTAFQVSTLVLWVNGLWFSSLACSLGAAMAAMVVKQWIQFYSPAKNSGNAHDNAQRRQYQYNALHQWRVPDIINVLPLLMHLSVGLFLVGLVLQLWQINFILAVVMVGILGTVLAIYLVTLVLPLIYAACPYKNSAVVQLRDSLHFLHLHLWEAWFRILEFINYLATQQKWDPLLDIEKTLSKLIQVYEHTPSYMEKQEILQLTDRLEADSVIWLLDKSQNQDTIHIALQYVKELSPVPALVDTFLDHGVLDTLAQKSRLPLPQKAESTAYDYTWPWPYNSMTPHDEIFQDLSETTDYMLSLMSIWHHPCYLLSERYTYPALSAPQHKSEYTPLFGDWLILWRSILRKYDNDLEEMWRGDWDIKALVALVCTETHYHHLHPHAAPLLPGLDDEKTVLDDLLILLDFAPFLNRECGSDIVCMILDTLAFILVDLQKEEDCVLRPEILKLLVILFTRNLGFENNLVLEKLDLCIQLYTMESSKGLAISTSYHTPSPSKDPTLSSQATCLELIENFQAFEGEDMEAIIDRCTAYIFHTNLERDDIDEATTLMFEKIPARHISAFLDSVSTDPLEFVTWDSFEWFLDLLCHWLTVHTDDLSFLIQLTRLASALLHYNEQTADAMYATSEKFLPVLCSIMLSDDNTGNPSNIDSSLANIVCSELCFALGRSLGTQPESSNEGLFNQFLKLGTMDKIMAFLMSSAKSAQCNINWSRFINMWDDMLQKETEQGLEQDLHTAFTTAPWEEQMHMCLERYYDDSMPARSAEFIQVYEALVGAVAITLHEASTDDILASGSSSHDYTYSSAEHGATTFTDLTEKSSHRPVSDSPTDSTQSETSPPEVVPSQGESSIDYGFLDTVPISTDLNPDVLAVP